MAAGLPAPQAFNVPSSGIIQASTPTLLNQGFFHVPSNLREARLHSYNVAYQRELFWGLTGEVAYVGNIARGIIADFNLNAGMVPGQDNAGRPFFTQFGKIASVQTWYPTDTNYNSLQIKVDRRFRNGFLVTNSLTRGRAINYSDDNGGVGTPANPELSRGLASFNRRFMYNATFVWDIPFANNSPKLLKAILGGWQVSGIFTAQSGTPINFTANAAALRAPGNTQRPNVSGTPKVFGDIGPGKLYFDTSLFSAPAANTFGNMLRNDSITGPGYTNLDGTMIKRFRFSERIGAEIRIDALNVTNSPNFINPDGAFGSPTFGQVNATIGGERLVRFGARITF
jgi:hypothetical protein